MSLEERHLILAKIEGSYGVDPSPVAGTDALLSSGKVGIEIVEVSVQRNVALPYYGRLKNINIGEGVRITIPLEVRGSGVATTPPRLGVLHRAGNFTQSIGADYVAYDRNSAQDGESCAIYFYQDGLLWKVLGCMTESIKLTAKANGVAAYEFGLIGLWGGPASITDIAFPAPTFETTIPPLFQSAAFSIDGYAGVIENFTLNVKNRIGKKVDANAATGVSRYRIVGLDSVDGSVDPEVVAKATYDPWTTWSASATGAISVTIGSVAGNRLLITIPNALKKAPKFGEREGVKTHQIEFEANPTLAAGNNEVQFKYN